jgi:protein disulfide-isomerase A1
MLRSILLLAAVLAFSAAGSDVIEGHAGNFKDITKDGLTLVEFYAPWCGHCKKLAPEWEKAATALKGQASLVKVDATVEADLGTQFGVRGYPTIKVFRDGQPSDYEGGRTAEAIVQFVRKRLSPAVEELTSADAIKEFQLKYPVAIILYAASKDDDSYVQFESQAKVLRDDYTFGLVTNGDLFEGNTAGSVVMYKHFDDLKSAYSGDVADKKAFAAWIKLESFRLMDEIGPENYKMYIDRGLPLAWLFLDTSKKEDTDAAKDVFQAVAAAFKGKLSFVYLDGTRYSQMVQKFGHTGKTYPVLAIDNGDGKYFSFPEGDKITKPALTEFTEKYVAGTLSRTIKSEPTPENPTIDGLTTVVGNTFESVVLKSDKDVLIEFYAPWCGHCKSLAPIYKKLAKSLADVSTATVALMDATANDPTGPFDIQGFPTLYFVPAGKAPITYEGERTAVEMLRFVKKHATHPINVEENQISDEF